MARLQRFILKIWDRRDRRPNPCSFSSSCFFARPHLRCLPEKVPAAVRTSRGEHRKAPPSLLEAKGRGPLCASSLAGAPPARPVLCHSSAVRMAPPPCGSHPAASSPVLATPYAEAVHLLAPLPMPAKHGYSLHPNPSPASAVSTPLPALRRSRPNYCIASCHVQCMRAAAMLPAITASAACRPPASGTLPPDRAAAAPQI